jgi:hypothetical protein
MIVAATNWPQNGRSVNEGLLKQCNVQWPPWTSTETANTTGRGSTPSVQVLLASPGTTSKLCVGYGSNSDNAFDLPLNSTVIPLGSSTGGVEFAAEPKVLSVLSDNNGLSPTGVAYAVFTLSVANDSKGFYVLEFPGCLQLLASGYSPSRVNASDFGSWIQQAQSVQCEGNAQVNLYFVSESNLDVMSVGVVSSVRGK